MTVATVEAAKIGIDALKQPNEILAYIQTVMFFQPLMFFKPGDNGGWIIGEEEFKTLPPAIGCLIEHLEYRTTRTRVGKGEDSTEREEVSVWVKLVSKTKAMELAAKHQLGSLVNINQKVTIDWDRMSLTSEQAHKALTDDPIERQIVEVLAHKVEDPSDDTPISPSATSDESSSDDSLDESDD